MLNKKSLTKICVRQLKKLSLYDDNKYIKCLKKELKVIDQRDHYQYFSTLVDKKQKIKTNKNGLLVAFLLGLTTVDPIKNKIEHKFILHGDYPDIDQDIEDRYRDNVKVYLSDKYNYENVSNIITFSRLRVKSLLRDLGRIYSESSKTDPVAKIIANNENYEQAFEKYKELQELKTEMDKKDPLFFKALLQLDGAYRHYSKHASGYVISPIKLSSIVPLMKQAGQDNMLTAWCEGQDQEEKRELTDVGLIKFDLLGLSSLTIVHRTIDLIKKTYPDFEFDFETLDLSDKKVLKQFQRGHSVATFQFESPGIRKFIKNLKPDCFDNLIAVNALYRPGPIGSGMLDEFIENKKNPDKIKYIDKRLKPILNETYGCLVYQEQIMEICAVLGQYTSEETNDIRKLLTKFIQKGKDLPKNVQKKLEFQKQKLIKRFVDNGVSESNANKILNQLMEFNKYSFNKSHSAAYASLAYVCQYLKTYYPIEYMTSALIVVSEKEQYLEKYIKESIRLKLEFTSIDINQSKTSFYTDHKKIYLGFNKVFGCAIKSAQVLENNQPYDNMDDFLEKIKGQRISRTLLSRFFQLGAFNCFYQNEINAIKNNDEQFEFKQKVKKEIMFKLAIKDNLYVYGLDKDIQLGEFKKILRIDENCLRYIYGDDYYKYADIHSLNLAKSGCELCELGCKKENLKLITRGHCTGELKDVDVIFVNDSPFMKRKGKNAKYDLKISNMLEKFFIKHGKTIYFTNLMNCSNGYGKKFEPENINACKTWVFNEVIVLKPKIIVTIGKLSREVFDGTYNELTSVFLNKSKWKVYSTYNPYYVLLDNKRKLREDNEYIKSLDVKDDNTINIVIDKEAERRQKQFYKKLCKKILKIVLRK